MTYTVLSYSASALPLKNRPWSNPSWRLAWTDVSLDQANALVSKQTFRSKYLVVPSDQVDQYL